MRNNQITKPNTYIHTIKKRFHMTKMKKMMIKLNDSFLLYYSNVHSKCLFIHSYTIHIDRHTHEHFRMKKISNRYIINDANRYS